MTDLTDTQGPDGADTGTSRESLCGVKLGPSVDRHAITVGDQRIGLHPRRTDTNPEFTAHRIELAEGVEVLGTYPDGSPAVVKRKLGEGSAVYFAANPFTPASLLDEPSWVGLLKGLQQQAGEELDQPIWRFRLPAPSR